MPLCCRERCAVADMIVQVLTSCCWLGHVLAGGVCSAACPGCMPQRNPPELVAFSKNATSCLITDVRNDMRMLAACLLPVRIQHAA